jgi:antitoxin component YwqK of YwqJK toxin-antitoxin module
MLRFKPFSNPMKKIFLFTLIIILQLMWGCSPREVDIRELRFGDNPLVADSIFIKKQQTTLVFHEGEKFSGYSVEKYGNGQLRSKLEFKVGLADGTQEAFYLNGKPRFLCTIKRGHLIKEFKQYFENGNIKRIGSYNKDGLLEGISTVYNEDGSIHESVSLKDGNYDGPYVEYFANGKVYRKFNYVKGIKEGDAEVFNEDGSSAEKVVFSNGIIKESTSEEPPSSENTSATSTIATFQNALNALGYNIPGAKGTLDDETKKQLKSFQEDYQIETSIGKIDIATAKMLILALKQKDVQGTEQLQRELNSFSTTSTSSSSIEDNDKKHNIERINYDDGSYYLGEIKNGLRNGKGKVFNDGKILWDGEWVGDKLNGKGKLYHENGNICFDGDFVNDMPNGVAKYYDETGRLLYDGEFKNGKMEGRGTLYSDTDGTSNLGAWVDGKFIPDSPSRRSTTTNSSINTNGQDIVKCSYCGKDFHMKDGYVQTSTDKTAWSWASRPFSLGKQFGHWFCSKECAYKSGIQYIE